MFASAVVAARGVRRYASSDCRTPKRSGATGPVGRSASGIARARAGSGGRRRRPFVGRARGARALDHEPAQLGRLERDRRGRPGEGSSARAAERRVLGDEHVVLESVAVAVVDALDPPRGVGRDLDARLAAYVAELPLGAAAVLLDVELGRQPEIALAPRREANVRADPRDAERADVLALEVVADHVPRAVLGQQGVRVERPLLFARRDRSTSSGTSPCAASRSRPRACRGGPAARASSRGRAPRRVPRCPSAAPPGRPPSGRARGSGARAAAARRTRSVPRGGRSRSAAPRARRRRARAPAGSSAPSAACRAPRP